MRPRGPAATSRGTNAQFILTVAETGWRLLARDFFAEVDEGLHIDGGSGAATFPAAWSDGCEDFASSSVKKRAPRVSLGSVAVANRQVPARAIQLERPTEDCTRSTYFSGQAVLCARAGGFGRGPLRVAVATASGALVLRVVSCTCTPYEHHHT